MSYNSKPNPEHVRKFAERMKTKWQAQSELDDIMLAYTLMENEIDVAGDGTRPVKGFRSGVGGIMLTRDAALLTVTPPIHVNPPTEDQDDIEFASEILEPWLAGMWRFSQQQGPVWDRLPMMLRTLGRAWSRVDHFDSLWSDDNDEYKGLNKKLNEADTAEKIAEAKKDIRNFKVDENPIKWRFVDPRGTWAEFDGTRRLSEVIEIRKMTAAAIKDQGWDVDLDGENEREYEVYYWSNWFYTAVMIEKTDKLAYEFHHNMGKSPYSLMEAELMPPNDKGIRWKGGLFYATGMIDTFDEILSDLRENHRDNTRRPVIIRHDPNLEQPELTGGRPEKLKYGPGAQLDIWTSEEILLGPIPELGEQSLELLRFAYNLIQQTQMRPAEEGESKSGDSQNKFVTQLQVAERGFDPSIRAINECAWDVCVSFLRCVRALGEEVFVIPGWKGKGVLGLKPEKTRGQEKCIQPRARRAIPIDQNIEAALAERKLSIGLSLETVLEDMGYENPDKEVRKAKKSQLTSMAFEQVVAPILMARIQQKANSASPEQLTEMSGMAASAPPELLGVLEQAGANLGVATANIGRTGVPQQPQMPQEQVIA